ncbi:hypothetical protein [uncultured Pelagimonas sp.]|uniref:hypothetical protein n=1 Tax=uncultured Pelagimonas sp. TaxID=1618102 RepID=UPI0026317937|nr:hypothetical protein [uncultured Pelagimonas sp.]
MGITAFVTLATLGLAAVPDHAPKGEVLAQAVPFMSTQGIVVPRGDVMTTAKGCSYQRTQAPGHPPRWILIVNPQRLGLPKPPRRCSGMM